ncbi:helix-turn-helix domain-containing protein [Cytophagaceae bacterium YF14B1]|uniref:Helix-turn-helix domain-containing protein n=1 Tax=Xanthocytophaga flava TaxID=3048013 RepID=A0AAE3QTT6_9BACT|nr:helix-turn-helix domain-containing protein [Xanthocytophaga flavus]MDJ1483335.1 helix-turn-helix domain-containing protein [Xanthocytophaga flavus]
MLESVLHYIHTNFDQELSLDILAEQANYSSFHFHRLFKEQIGEAPKQYILRLRLEKACKDLIFYPYKSIYEIAMDCGFSSASVFARAFRRRYQINAEQYRELELQKLTHNTTTVSLSSDQLEIVRMERFVIAYEIALLDKEENSMQAFRNIYQWAEARDLTDRYPHFYGVFLDSPVTTKMEQCRYLAGIRVYPSENIRFTEKMMALGGAKHAQIQITGGMSEVVNYALHFKKQWIAQSGYEIIPESIGFEAFSQLDFNLPYASHNRKICIAVQPK